MSNPNATGRPKVENPKGDNIVFRVSASEKEALQKAAKMEKISTSDFIRKHLKKFLD
jgi:uncharacterized protein (DUF1778 family)